MKRLAAALMVLVLPGCSAETVVWVKPGATPEQVAADRTACHRLAMQQAARESDFTPSPMAAIPNYPGTWDDYMYGAYGGIDPLGYAGPEPDARLRPGRVDDLTNFCLKSKGYQREVKPAPTT